MLERRKIRAISGEVLEEEGIRDAYELWGLLWCRFMHGFGSQPNRAGQVTSLDYADHVHRFDSEL